uniref:ArfGAP with SH3 domain, ankyrin repeat and PH domain 2a n=1 Tax=Eptatretus burgeri TaxID=7764 RepID=A0A8C4QY84_EPTBU
MVKTKNIFCSLEVKLNGTCIHNMLSLFPPRTQYLIKVNEIKTKKGVDLLQNLIKYYHAQCNFFQDGQKVVESFKMQVDKLANELHTIKQVQDEERRQLCSLRDMLKPCFQAETKEDSQVRQSIPYNMHQPQGNKEHGSERTGYLYKKSEGIRKVWQKRACAVRNGYLTISHGTVNRLPAKLNLLTCQVKSNIEEKKCFDLISHNRTYHFQADDEQDCIIWVSVLSNSKEEALNKAFRGEPGAPNGEGLQDLTKEITAEVLRTEGNQVCCDCNQSDPSWLATNLGILICIECSGIHREMGVHFSRIQSLKLDKVATSELLLVRNIGNCMFNDVMEARLVEMKITKPSHDVDMAARKEYIVAKYVERRFARRCSSTSAAKLHDLYNGVISRDIMTLLELYAYGMDFTESFPPMPGEENGETALHLVIRKMDRCSLHIADFLIQNCGNLDKQTVKGNTALHYACNNGQTECIKLLLRSKASINLVNEEGETALEIAQRLKQNTCEILLQDALSGRFNAHLHVEYEWRLGEDSLDESDDDLDEKSPGRRESSQRPLTMCLSTGSIVPTTPPVPHRTRCSSHSMEKPRIGTTAFLENELYWEVMDGASPAPSREGTPYFPPSPPGSLPQTTVPVSSGPPLPPRHKVLTGTSPPKPPPPLPPETKKKMLMVRTEIPLVPSHSPTDPPSPVPPTPPIRGPSVRDRNLQPPPPVAKTPSLLDVTGQQQPTSSEGASSSKSVRGPRVLPPHPPVSQKPSGDVLQAPQLPSDVPPTSQKPEHSPPPQPAPRKAALSQPRQRRARAIYDCQADHIDELTFDAGEVIVVMGQEDAKWFKGEIEGNPERSGLFPSDFVHFLQD